MKTQLLRLDQAHVLLSEYSHQGELKRLILGRCKNKTDSRGAERERRARVR